MSFIISTCLVFFHSVYVQYQNGNLLNPSHSITSMSIWCRFLFDIFKNVRIPIWVNSIYLYCIVGAVAVVVVVNAVRWNLVVLKVNLTWIVVLPLDVMVKSSVKWPYCIIKRVKRIPYRTVLFYPSQHKCTQYTVYKRVVQP